MSRQAPALGAAPRALRWLLPLAILLAVAAAFAPAFAAGFVNYDDPENLLRNREFRGLSGGHLSWMLRSARMGHYQPLSWLSLAVDHALWGRGELGALAPAGFHATNVLLHAITALLVYALALAVFELAGLGRGTWSLLSAAFAALVFALHPLRVESVAWITERRDVLSAPFFVLCALAWLRWGRAVNADRLEPRWLVLAGLLAAASAGAFFAGVDLSRPGRLGFGPAGIPGIAAALALWAGSVACLARAAPGAPARWLALASVSLLISLFAKAWGMVMPALLLVADAWPLRRATGAGSPVRAWGRLALEKLPLLALSAVFAVLAVWAQRSQANTVKDLTQHPLLERALQAGYGLVFYPLKTVWPSGLAPIYDLPLELGLRETRFLAAGLGAIALTVALVALRRRAPGVLAAWCAYAVCVSPVLGLFQSGPQLVADRYAYLSCIPFALLAGALLRRCLIASPRWRAALLLAAGCVLAALGVACSRQAAVWRDSRSLWEHALAAQPQSPMAHLNLGTVRHLQASEVADPEAKRALYAEAMQLFERGLELAPLPRLLANMALVEGSLAEVEPEKAAEHRSRALELSGQALSLAREQGPVDPELEMNHAVHLFNAGRVGEALDLFERYLRVRPGSAQGHFRYGIALLAAGRAGDAAREFERALELDPANAAAREMLAGARASGGG